KERTPQGQSAKGKQAKLCIQGPLQESVDERVGMAFLGNHRLGIGLSQSGEIKQRQGRPKKIEMKIKEEISISHNEHPVDVLLSLPTSVTGDYVAGRPQTLQCRHGHNQEPIGSQKPCCLAHESQIVIQMFDDVQE